MDGRRIAGAGRRALARVTAVLTLLVLVTALAAPAALSASRTFSQTDFSAYATGTVLHAGAVWSGDTQLADAEQGFSAAVVDAGGIGAMHNEVRRQIAPAGGAKRSYARGSGLEVGLAVSPDTDNQVILAGKAEASAPGGEGSSTKDVPVKLAPLAYASLLRGQADARWDAESCILGADVARGIGYAADVQLLETGTANADGSLSKPLVASDAEGPARAVGQTRSRVVLIPQIDRLGKIVGPNFGILSEVRATIAPITLFRGMPTQITIEFLGEWVLQVVSTGLPGGSFVHYGPGKVSPETPILRTVDALGAVTNLLTTQGLLGRTGLNVSVPGVVELAIGEEPHAVGGLPTTSPAMSAAGTSASAAVDAVRVRVAGGMIADVRVGHLEARAVVPEGGITCPIPVTKRPTRPSVSVGSGFGTPITVRNPFACELRNVRVVDEVDTSGAARFAITGTRAPASQASSGAGLAEGSVVWANIGTIPAGGSRTVRVDFEAQQGAGKILDTATATGSLGDCSGTGESITVAGVTTSIVRTALNGTSRPASVSVSKVLGRQVPREPLPATGLADVLIAVLGLGILASAALLARSLIRV